MATTILSDTIEISRTKDEVFSFVVHIENYQRWFPGVGGVHSEDALEDGTPGKYYDVQLVKPNGDPLESSLKVVECEPGAKLATEAEVMGNTLTTHYLIESVAEGVTRLSLSMTSDARGFRAAIRQRLMRKVLRAKVHKSLENLRIMLEEDSARSMLAMRNYRFGPASEVLSLETYAPRPEPAKGEVLVAQKASSINHIDVARRGGYGRKLLGLTGVKGLPMVLGNDIYGVVEAVGPEVEGFKVGDVVFGAKGPSAQGAFAQFVAAPATMLALAPKGVDEAQLAASPYAFFSAWGPLVGDCALNTKDAGNTAVFVQGGGGAVGSCAVAIAKSFGAFVAANCGPNDMDRVKALGADMVFDYRDDKLAGELKDFDIVFCTANPGEQDRMLELLRRGGGARYATVIHPTMSLGDELGAVKGLLRARSNLRALNKTLRDSDRKVYWSRYLGNKEAIDTLADLLSSGHLELCIAQHFPLEEMVAAQELMESGVSGKLVIDIPPVS